MKNKFLLLSVIIIGCFVAKTSALIADNQMLLSAQTNTHPFINQYNNEKSPFLLWSKIPEKISWKAMGPGLLNHFRTYQTPYLVSLWALSLSAVLLVTLIQNNKKDAVIKNTAQALLEKLTLIQTLQETIKKNKEDAEKSKQDLINEWKSKLEKMQKEALVDKKNELIKEKLLQLQNKTSEIINRTPPSNSNPIDELNKKITKLEQLILEKDTVIKNSAQTLLENSELITTLQETIKKDKEDAEKSKQQLIQEWKSKFEKMQKEALVDKNLEIIEQGVNNNLLKRENSEINESLVTLKNKIKEKMDSLKKQVDQTINQPIETKIVESKSKIELIKEKFVQLQNKTSEIINRTTPSNSDPIDELNKKITKLEQIILEQENIITLKEKAAKISEAQIFTLQSIVNMNSTINKDLENKLKNNSTPKIET